MPARKPRPSCPADHAHAANSACYFQHRCGCTDCLKAQNAREALRRRQKAYGTYTRGYVDAEPVREHLNYLRANGMGARTIESIAGIPRITIAGIIWGRPGQQPAKKVRPTTASKLLAVQPKLELLADHAIIDARGTRRRLQALARCGWTAPALTARSATPITATALARLFTADRVTARNARLVVALYDAVWDQQPPMATPTQRAMSQRTADRARRRHWAVPLAWDDIDTDEKPAPVRAPRSTTAPTIKRNDTVDEIAIELALSGQEVRLTPAERRACVLRLHAKQYSDGLIADTLHCASKTIERIRDELDLPAWEDDELISRRAA